MRTPLIVVAATFAAMCAWAGTRYESGPPAPSSTLDGPLTVNGRVDMTSGPMMVDGGVSTRTMDTSALTADAGAFVTLSTGSISAQSYAGGTAAFTGLDVAGPASLGPNVTLRGTVTTTTPLTSPSVSADAGTFGALVAGPATLGPPVNITGPMIVTGSASFSQPPSGLIRVGELVRGANLGLAVGCQNLGTIVGGTVAGVTIRSSCNVSYRPPAILNLGITLDCVVTAPDTVVVRACALVALLSAPSGTYGVTLVGE